MPQSSENETLQYRVASQADAEAIARLHVASWRDAYREFVPAAFLDALKVELRIAYWREEIGDPAITVLLAESPQALVGFCACGPSHDSERPAPGAWEIYHLHVPPSLRGQGVGAQLFASAVEHGTRAGCRALTLWVIAPNAAARRFYTRQGMRTDGAEQIRPLGGGPPVSEVRYRLDLPAASQTPGTAA
jgi:ribosomal protein S18 acetylase RimI-like enzyme